MIDKNINIVELIQKYPQAAMVLMQSGMGCIGCAAAQFETLEQGCNAHGIDADAMVKNLNTVLGLDK
jgi:hybrid cluster-associated redox disulfide protein